MTVLGIPYLTGQDDLRRCIESIDVSADVVVVDNSKEGIPASWEMFGPRTLGDLDQPYYLEMPHNLGVAASWNLIVKAYPAEPFWLIANHDTVFAPGDLQRLIDEMGKPGPRWVGMNGDWRVFGINAECIELVGFWDERFTPCYLEDCDYEYRCTLAGVPWYFIDGGATHVGSASIKEPRYALGNSKSYPANVALYREKWGGPQRGGETFTTPFNLGGLVSDWVPDIQRVRDLAW